MISLILLYANTIKYLKFKQIFFRIFYKFYKSKKLDESYCGVRNFSGKLISSDLKTPSLKDSKTFTFLNKEGCIDERGWNGEERDKLWRYNQHYFDDLNSSFSNQRKEWHASLIEKWINENPFCRGIGWDPYPTSLRIVNWIKWSHKGNILNETS